MNYEEIKFWCGDNIVPKIEKAHDAKKDVVVEQLEQIVSETNPEKRIQDILGVMSTDDIINLHASEKDTKKLCEWIATIINGYFVEFPKINVWFTRRVFPNAKQVRSIIKPFLISGMMIGIGSYGITFQMAERVRINVPVWNESIYLHKSPDVDLDIICTAANSGIESSINVNPLISFAVK